jgi:hypothetical protein
MKDQQQYGSSEVCILPRAEIWRMVTWSGDRYVSEWIFVTVVLVTKVLTQ